MWLILGFPAGTCGKEPAYQSRRSLGWEDPLEEGHGNPIQYSCLENPMDRGAWWATVHRAAKSQTWLKQFSMDTHTTPYQDKCFCGGETVSCSAVSNSL